MKRIVILGILLLSLASSIQADENVQDIVFQGKRDLAIMRGDTEEAEFYHDRLNFRQAQQGKMIEPMPAFKTTQTAQEYTRDVKSEFFEVFQPTLADTMYPTEPQHSVSSPEYVRFPQQQGYFFPTRTVGMQFLYAKQAQPVQFVSPPVQKNMTFSFQISESPLDTIERVAKLYPPSRQEPEFTTPQEPVQEVQTDEEVSIQEPSSKIEIETETTTAKIERFEDLPGDMQTVVREFIAKSQSAEQKRMRQEQEALIARQQHQLRLVVIGVLGVIVCVIIANFSFRRFLSALKEHGKLL